MSTGTIKTIVDYKAKEWNGKYIHEWACEGTVDGTDQKFLVSIFSPAQAKPELPVGQEVNLEYAKEYQGVKQYKYRKSSGGFSGGGGKTGYQKNENAIASQCCLKAAVAYAGTHLPDCAPEDITEVASRFLKWIKENS